MITSITLQFQTNKNFVNPELTSEKKYGRTLYGERTTVDLQELLRTDIEWLQKFHALIEDLNADLLTCDISKKIVKHIGSEPSITKKTKHKRTYSIAGLTIHEEDQVYS